MYNFYEYCNIKNTEVYQNYNEDSTYEFLKGIKCYKV
jgi:hypothetical protein